MSFYLIFYMLCDTFVIVGYGSIHFTKNHETRRKRLLYVWDEGSVGVLKRKKKNNFHSTRVCSFSMISFCHHMYTPFFQFVFSFYIKNRGWLIETRVLWTFTLLLMLSICRKNSWEISELTSG